MLDFMVIGLPRSGTTWASVWLNCPHDPLYSKHYSEWDAQPWQGVSCTGIWRWPEWVNAHPARKIVLVRDKVARHNSLARVLPPAFTAESNDVLAPVNGHRVYWSDIFDPVYAKDVWLYLRPGIPFDVEQHNRLRHVKMEPDLHNVPRDVLLHRRLRQELPPGTQ